MDNKFNVVYTGLQEGIAAEEFISKFCSKFGVSEKKAQQIVNSSSDVVVKKNLEEKKAAQYRTAFESCGMIIRVDEISMEPEVASGLSLEPMSNEFTNAADTNAIEKNNTETESSGNPRCPKCGSDQIEDDECQACGIYISKYLQLQKSITIARDKESIDDEPTEQFDAKNINNPYETPEAPLERSSITKDGQGSLEGGLNGDYDFSIGDIYSEAWERTKGVKGTFLMAWGIYALVTAVISFIFYFIPFDSQAILETLVSIPVQYPIMAGITLMGIHRSVDADINATSVLSHYGRVIPITFLTLLMIILIALGMMLLIIPGIYLGIAYMMALPLMMDRNMGIWESLETSRKAISKHWFRIFFIYMLLAGLFIMTVMIPFLISSMLGLSLTSMVVMMIPFFIGLIWVLPMSSMIQGVLYKYIFGVESVE